MTAAAAAAVAKASVAPLTLNAHAGFVITVTYMDGASVRPQHYHIMAMIDGLGVRSMQDLYRAAERTAPPPPSAAGSTTSNANTMLPRHHVALFSLNST